jgi:hypothetical protein
MQAIRVWICRWVDDDQPGWVECELRDDTGSTHVFREKVPVVTHAALGPLSRFPRPGVIACVVLGRHRAADGHEVVSIDTQLPWGMESTSGLSRFDVDARNLVDIGDGQSDGDA